MPEPFGGLLAPHKWPCPKGGGPGVPAAWTQEPHLAAVRTAISEGMCPLCLVWMQAHWPVGAERVRLPGCPCCGVTWELTGPGFQATSESGRTTAAFWPPDTFWPPRISEWSEAE